MRTSAREGFTLLELLIYILFLSFIALAAATLMVRLWQASSNRHKKQESLITLYTAYDMLLRDIHQATADREQWKEVDKECIIWRTKRGDVGWQREDEQLVRREGRYHKKKNRWSKQTKNLIAKHVDAVQFVCVGEPEIAHVSFFITTGSTTVEGVVAPLCGRLAWKEGAGKKGAP